MSINEDGNVVVMTGHPDIGGSRASTANIAAELLGIDHSKMQVLIGDTSSIGFSNLTGGSRVTFASAMVVTQSAEKVIKQLRQRAAKIWKIDRRRRHLGQRLRQAGRRQCRQVRSAVAGPDRRPGDRDRRADRRRRLDQHRRRRGRLQHAYLRRRGRPRHRPRLGHALYRFQDVGRAIHPDYVEGQMQGGVAQGIGWALSEEYIYDKNGKLDNPGFLDYRMPVTSDLPMLDTRHHRDPQPEASAGRARRRRGAAGAGAWRRSPMPCTARWVIRLDSLPMSPPKVLEALDAEEPLAKAAD